MKPTASERRLPRYWKVTIGRITGLHYCDRHCGCGGNSNLWWWPVTAGERRLVPDWLPGWTNGSTTESLWEWLTENGKTQEPSK